MSEKNSFLKLINKNISEYGYHITVVSSCCTPRYAYSIGLKEMFGFELVFAGGLYFLEKDISKLFEKVVIALKKSLKVENQTVKINNGKAIRFGNVDKSWSKKMLLGVFDYYGIKEINAYQIIPDSSFFTLEIPDMSNTWEVASEPVWKWLDNDKSRPTLLPNSTVVTNISTLFGDYVLEALRCEENLWEMFSIPGPDVKEKDVRVVPLATLVGIDNTLTEILNKQVGKGAWRELENLQWQDWG